MRVTFGAADPRQRARPSLDDVLRRGVDQLAIACAFLTAGGAEVLKHHAAQLRLASSFVVVAWEPPTIFFVDALKELHALFPGNLYLHLGALTPVERRVGPGLMHSKVFLARHGSECLLWTGSHNLTASAMQGVNCEAAIILEGSFDEQPFQDALRHLEQCRREAIVFDPLNLPPKPSTYDTLVIHAERRVALKAFPWFVHLRPPTVEYDRAMRPPAAVWLYLYPAGTLRPGFPHPRPEAAYSGTLTALNFTEHHPERGIPAAWQGADFVIGLNDGVFHFTEPKPYPGTPTQAVFRVEAQEDPSTVWLSESPTPKLERLVGETWTSDVDPEFRKFFTRDSLQGKSLVHREYRSMRATVRVLRKEVGAVETEALQERLGAPSDTEVVVEELRSDDRLPFIYRAKYRI
jgi:hypothetical protein